MASMENRPMPTYNMRHKYRGLALIFNHKTFEDTRLRERTGTDIDCADLSGVLEELGFKVNVHKDCSLEDLLRYVSSAAQQDHSDNDCILIAILSHGELGYIYARDAQYKLDTVWSYFTGQHCPTLAGKPKLFFIQTCEGDRLDTGATLKRIRMTETEGDSSMSYKIPAHADILIAYCTIPGFYAWRDTERGSWFIQSLCAELYKSGEYFDILTLLTFVSQRVAVDYEQHTLNSPDHHQRMQIPCTISMLTGILRLDYKNPTSVIP